MNKKIFSSKQVFRAFTVFLAFLMVIESFPRIFTISGKALEDLSPQQIEQLVGKSSASDADGDLPENQLYIYDISSATADTYSEAKRLLNNAGYVVLDQDANYGSEDGRCCLLGYKLTTDRDKALTSLSTMEMSGGYEFYSYRKVLKDKADGLDQTLKGFIASCKEMKRLVNAKNPIAVYAYDTLNILCVPENASSRKGVPLGEYLISDSTSYSDYETLILVCRSDVLTFINNLLACACSECYENTELYEREEYVSDPDWIIKAVNRALEMISSMTEEEAENIEDEYYDIVDEFSYVIEEDTGEVEKRFLHEIVINKKYTDILDDYGIDTPSVYDLLISYETVPVACFLMSLPETITYENFLETLTEFIDDEEQKIKKTVPPMPAIISPWMRDMTNYINRTPLSPYDDYQSDKIIEQYKLFKSDNDIFIYFITKFIETCRHQNILLQQVKDDLGSGATQNEIISEYAKRVKELNAKKEQGEDPEPDYLFYAGAYQILKSYEIDQKDWLVMSDGKKCSNLAEYFELIADASGKTQEALAYAFTSSLNDYQCYNAKTAGISMFILDGTFCHSDLGDLRKKIEENKTVICDAYREAGYAEDECTVWYGTNRDLLDTESLALTSAAKRHQDTNDDLWNSYESLVYGQDMKMRIGEAMEIIGIVSSVAGVLWAGGAYGLYLAGFASLTGVSAMVNAGVGSMVGCSTVAGLGTAGMVASALGAIGFIVFIVTMIVFVVLLILNIAYDITDKYEVEYTEIPTTILDGAQDENRKVIEVKRYDVVRDVVTGKPADLNDMEESGAKRWLALYYSRESAAGSPLVAYPDSNRFLVGQVDDMSIPDKAVPVAKFGSNVPFNLNAYHPEDDENAVYLFYYSENSVKGIADINTPGKYLYDIRLSIARSAQMAKNYILAMTNYACLDVNLTPDTGFYTYIGYSTTNKEEYAITDIRAEYASTSSTMKWGDSKYISALDDEEVQVLPRRTVLPEKAGGATEGLFLTEFYFNLYFSKSQSVGDPVLADSLAVTNNINNVKNGYEYVRWFSGGAFDFLADRTIKIDEDSHVFVSYAPEESKRVYRTNDSVEYLAGIALCADYHTYYESDGDDWDGFKYADEYGYKLLPINLSLDALDTYEDSKNAPLYRSLKTGTYMMYAVTVNPKKAITDIGTFTGEPKGDGNLPNNILRNEVGFEAAQIFKQHNVRDLYSYIKLYSSHAYFTKIEDEGIYFTLGDKWDEKDYALKPRALYTAGSQNGILPLKVTDVVYSTNYYVLPKSGSAKLNQGIYSLATMNQVKDTLGSGWKSVHALEQYYYDEYDEDGEILRPGVNLGLSLDEKKGDGCVIYLYYRNTRKALDKDGKIIDLPVIAERGEYLASAEIVGSLSENAAYDEARFSAMTFGQDIINLTNPLFTDAGERYDVLNDSVIYIKGDATEKYSDTCYYIVVTYQDVSSNAIASLRIAYQDGNTVLPSSLSLMYDKVNNVDFKKGKSYATTVRPEKTSDEKNKQKSKNNEGYVLYSATHDGEAARLAVLENGFGDNPFPGFGRRFAEDMNGNIFAANGDFKQSLALYCPTNKYIKSLMVIKGGNGITPQQMEIELSQRGYTEVIYADLFYGADLIDDTVQPVMIGIKRQNAPKGAIQGLVLSNEDLGENPKIDGLKYKPVAEVDMSSSSHSMVYLYYTIGSSSATQIWGERTALTNIGLSYRPGNTTKGRDTTYWNGMTDANKYPASLSGGNVYPLEVKGDDGKKAYINKKAYDETCAKINGTLGSKYADEFKAKHGYTWLVYTNHSGYTYSEYAEKYLNGEVTGTAEGDANLGRGSQINPSPSLVIAIVGISAAVLSGVGAAIYAKKRKKTQKNN